MSDQQDKRMDAFDEEMLAEFNGQGGKPIYVAHQGKVYDVTGSKMWRGGAHMKRHQAGKDLTTDIQAAPHGAEMLERYPQVGVLKKKEEALESFMPPSLAKFLKDFPVFRRHPHPMTVHFPIVFMIFAPVFNLLFLLTGNENFETTALHCLAVGLLFMPVVIATGFFQWWLNYLSKPMLAVTIKKWLSAVMLIVGLVVFVWRISMPDILVDFRAASLIYLLLVLSLAPLVSVVGWYGASLTFPIEKE